MPRLGTARALGFAVSKSIVNIATIAFGIFYEHSLTLILTYPFYLCFVTVDEDIADGGTEDVKEALLACFMALRKRHKKSFVKTTPLPATRSSPISRTKGHALHVVESEDVLL